MPIGLLSHRIDLYAIRFTTKDISMCYMTRAIYIDVYIYQKVLMRLKRFTCRCAGSQSKGPRPSHGAPALVYDLRPFRTSENAAFERLFMDFFMEVPLIFKDFQGFSRIFKDFQGFSMIFKDFQTFRGQKLAFTAVFKSSSASVTVTHCSSFRKHAR